MINKRIAKKANCLLTGIRLHPENKFSFIACIMWRRRKTNPSISGCVSGSEQNLCIPFLTTTINPYTFLLHLSLTCSLILRLHFYQKFISFLLTNLFPSSSVFNRSFGLIYRTGKDFHDMSSPKSLNLPTINLITC